MATSDIALQPIEVLWARFQERLSSDPHARIEDFALQHPEAAEEIRRVFPLMQELDQLGELEQPESSQLPTSIGRYPIARLIGVGGMGVVYEAQCVALRERIAIKVIASERLDAKNIKRFEQEARAVASLHHTNIVPIYEFGQEAGKHFYTMRLVEGPNLAEVTKLAEMSTSGDFSDGQPGDVRVYQLLARLAGNWALIANLGAQAALALEHAHGKEVLHRDIKPANLLVDESDKLWVTDFGLAKRVLQDNGLTSIFQTVGTPRYMAPEQAKGQGDHRSDIYSLGLTLLELATLQEGESPFHVHATEALPSARSINPKIPSDLDSVIAKATAFKPAERYQSAREMASDLEKCAARARRAANSRPRTFWWAAATVLLLITAAGLASWFTAAIVPAEPIGLVWTVPEGRNLAGELQPEWGDAEDLEIAGVDASAFRWDATSRALNFVQPANFEVPVDSDMDNVYEVMILAPQKDMQCSVRIEVQDLNEPPVLDEFVFEPDGETILLNRSQLESAWVLDVKDDRNRLFDGLFFSLGGKDRGLIKMTPQGVFVFDPRVSRPQPNQRVDADGDGFLDVELSVSDATQTWTARLEQSDDGKLALVKERIVMGAKLESQLIAEDCLIRRDVIDFATADGQTFFHLHPSESGATSLYRSQLQSDGTLVSTLLSEKSGLPAETIGLATCDGQRFMAVLRKRGEVEATKLVECELQPDGTFATTVLSENCGMSMSIRGFSWIDTDRFHHVRRLATGEASFYFSFLGSAHFANMPLSDSGRQYSGVCRGQAAWVERSPDSQSVAKPIRFGVR